MSTTTEPLDKTKVKECACAVEVPTPKEEVILKTEPPIETKPVEVKPVEAPKAPVSGIDTTNLQNQSAEQLKIAALESELRGLRATPTPTAKVSDELKDNIKTITEQVKANIRKNGFAALDVDMDKLIAERSTYIPSHASSQNSMAYASMREAVSTSGTIPGITLTNNSIIIPGKVTKRIIRPYTIYKNPDPGTDTVRFFKNDVPAVTSQTSGTTGSQDTFTLTSVALQPTQISGYYTKIYSDNMEDFNVDLVRMVTDAAVLRQTDYEANNILNTLSAEGTLTPLKWILGNDGTTIASSDVSGKTMKAVGIAVATEHLLREGYDQDQIAVAIHPQQWRELTLAADLTTWAQQGNPNTTTLGTLERLFGVEIFVTNKVEWKDNTTNDAYNAYAFIKNHSYLLGAKRDLTIKFHEIPEDNSIGVTANFRVGGKVLDANSIVRISSTTTNTAQ